MNTPFEQIKQLYKCHCPMYYNIRKFRCSKRTTVLKILIAIILISFSALKLSKEYDSYTMDTLSSLSISTTIPDERTREKFSLSQECNSYLYKNNTSYKSIEELYSHCLKSTTKSNCISYISQSQSLFEYPSMNTLENNLGIIQNMTYLVNGLHGGTVIDSISFMSDILHIPTQNIIITCYGIYCDIALKSGKKNNYFNVHLSNKLPTNHLQNLKKCCGGNRTTIFQNLEDFEAVQTIIKTGMETMNITKFDVIICTFPSFQCLYLWPFAKTFIIRIMTRFDFKLEKSSIVKWGKLLRIISDNCENIIIAPSNAYDWYYMQYLLNIENDKLLMWPNFGRNFARTFSSTFSSLNSISDQNEHLYIFASVLFNLPQCPSMFNVKDIGEYFKQSDGKIKWSTNKKLLYKEILLNNSVHGVIAIPYAVHTAKWMEYYSIGLQLFFPSLEFLFALDDECGVVEHRQSSLQSKSNHDIFLEWISYVQNSPCCGSNEYSPLTMVGGKYLLGLSDFYMDEHLMRHLIYFDSQKDLIAKIERYDELSLVEKRKRKTLQASEFEMLATKFKPYWIRAVSNALTKGDMQNKTSNNLELNELTKCMHNMNEFK